MIADLEANGTQEIIGVGNVYNLLDGQFEVLVIYSEHIKTLRSL